MNYISYLIMVVSFGDCLALPAVAKDRQPPRLVRTFEDFRLHMELHVARVTLLAEHLVKTTPQFSPLRDYPDIVREFAQRHDLAKLTDVGVAELADDVLARYGIDRVDLAAGREVLLHKLYVAFGRVPSMSALEKVHFYGFVDEVVNAADDRIAKEYLDSLPLTDPYLKELLHTLVDISDKVDRSMSPAAAEEFGVARMVPAHEYINQPDARRVDFTLLDRPVMARIMAALEARYQTLAGWLSLENYRARNYAAFGFFSRLCGRAFATSPYGPSSP